jgi:hypothetical protein
LIRSLTASYISIYEWTGNLGQGASDLYMVSRGAICHFLLHDKRMSILLLKAHKRAPRPGTDSARNRSAECKVLCNSADIGRCQYIKVPVIKVNE